MLSGNSRSSTFSDNRQTKRRAASSSRLSTSPRGSRAREFARFLSDTHFGWLDQYQPYKAGDRAAHHKLAILRELSNTDKHRVVHAAAVLPEGVELEFTDTSGVVSYESLELIFGEPLKDDTPMGHIRGVVVDRPDPRMEAHGPIEVRVVLDDPTNPVLHKAPVIQVLGLVGEIADGIVGWIAHQFEPVESGTEGSGPTQGISPLMG